MVRDSLTKNIKTRFNLQLGKHYSQKRINDHSQINGLLKLQVYLKCLSAMKTFKTFSSLVVGYHSPKLRTQKQNHHKLLEKKALKFTSSQSQHLKLSVLYMCTIIAKEYS